MCHFSEDMGIMVENRSLMERNTHINVLNGGFTIGGDLKPLPQHPRHPGPPKLRFGIWTPKKIPKTPNLRDEFGCLGLGGISAKWAYL